MLLVVGGIKGGGGKSTLATNLAVCAAMDNKKVLLIDADEQKSASDWADQREETSQLIELHSITSVALAGKSIHAQIQKMLPYYDLIIVDTGGRDTTSQRSSLSIANKFLVPFKPRSFDVWTIGAVRKLIEEIQCVNPELKSYYVINQGDSKGSDNSDAIDIISEIPSLKSISTIIGYRKAFSNAASEGLGVSEMLKQDRKAIEEMHQLYIQITS